MTVLLTRLCKQFTTRKSSNIKNIKLAHTPKIRLKRILLLAAILAPDSFLQANSSATTLVVAIFIPADARVIPNVYTDITSAKTPTASSPIELDIYILKNKVIICNIIELINSINVFKINSFIVFIFNNIIKTKKYDKLEFKH